MGRKLAALLVAGLLLATPAISQDWPKGPGKTRGQMIACVTRTHYFQMWDALENDNRALDYLVEKGFCAIPPAGVPVSVLGQDWEFPFVWRVRLYGENDAIEVWVAYYEIERL